MNKDELPELPHRAGCATKLGSMYLCNCGQPLRQAIREIEQLRDALAAMQAVEPVACKGLTDVQWMNIVNKNQAWDMWDKESAIHEVVKLVEAKLKEINSTRPQATSEAEAMLAFVLEHGLPTKEFGGRKYGYCGTRFPADLFDTPQDAIRAAISAKGESNG